MSSQCFYVVVIKGGLVEDVSTITENRAYWSKLLPSRKPDRLVHGEPVWFVERSNRGAFIRHAKTLIDKHEKKPRENLYGFFALCRLGYVLGSDEETHWALALLTQEPVVGKAIE